MRLEGKVAVITGAGSGMGRAMANLFAAEGARIVAAEWNAETLARGRRRSHGGRRRDHRRAGQRGVQADCERIIDKAVEAFGRLDVLCNNAGVMDINQGVGELTNEMWERVLGINLNGPMYLTRKAVPVMVAQGGGSIVNTASVAGVGGGAAGVAYTVSKHGLVGMTRNTAFRYAPGGRSLQRDRGGRGRDQHHAERRPDQDGPGGIARCQTWYAAIPGQLKATDIANLALFLASDEAKMINGAIIPADAGWSAA